MFPCREFLNLKNITQKLIYFDFTLADDVSIYQHFLFGNLLGHDQIGYLNSNIDTMTIQEKNKRQIPFINNCADLNFLNMECPMQIYKTFKYKFRGDEINSYIYTPSDFLFYLKMMK